MGGRKLALALSTSGRRLVRGCHVYVFWRRGCRRRFCLTGSSGFGLSPALTLTGLFIGIAVAVVGMYRMLMAILSGSDDD